MKLKFFWSIIVIILVPTVISVSTDPTTTITTAPSSATDTALETSAPPTSSSSLSTSSANRYATLNSINAYLQQKFGRSDTLSLRQSTPLKFNPLWTINDVKIDYSKVLGKSSSGTTVFLGYLRRNPSFKVAVKEFDLKQLIQRSGLSTNDALQYLSKETGVGIGSHPNILKVSKGLSRDGSKVYVFSEFCAKGDLVDLINSSRRSTDKAEFKKRIQCVFWQVIHGLVYLHAKDIHRKAINNQ